MDSSTMDSRRYRRAVAIAVVCLTGWLERPAPGQTIQLPSFHRFSYSGGVLVPDRGSASLGGVSRSYSSRTSRRGSGVARGGGLSHAGASARVTIIDHEAIDRQLRGLPADRRPLANGKPSAAAGSTATGTTATGSKRPAANPPADRSADPPAIDPDAEGKALVRYARRQYRAGHHASAFDAYQLALSALSPGLQALAEAEFNRVFPAGKRPTNHQRVRFASQTEAD